MWFDTAKLKICAVVDGKDALRSSLLCCRATALNTVTYVSTRLQSLSQSLSPL